MCAVTWAKSRTSTSAPQTSCEYAPKWDPGYVRANLLI
jgi:hypothetical protein